MRGAGQPSVPRNSITRMWFFRRMGWGDGMPAAWRRRRLRISFSAQVLTIFRGFDLQ